MRADVDAFFSGERTSANGKTEFMVLSEALDDWGLNGDTWSVRQFQLFVWSNGLILPFPGTYSEQPLWLTDDYETLFMVRRWWQLNDELPDKAGLPHASEIA